MPLDELKQKQNERKFGQWEELPKGGRRYIYEILSLSGWKAKYVKEVDTEEKTTRFYQEIYNDKNEVIEVHEKYPVDKGHRQVKGGVTYDNSQ